MAVFIPSLPENFNNSYGEEKVFNSLRTLDNNYVVFHSYNWVGIKERTIGEADFVVMHPTKGIMVIEVKSGEIEYKDGIWYQTNVKTKFKKEINPFSQARRSMYEIQDRLLLKYKFSEIPMICFAVWFTSMDIDKDVLLPAESPREIILDKSSLDFPKRDIDGIFNYWNKKYRNVTLNQKRFNDMVNFLCPHFHIVPKLRTSIEEAEYFYIQLTNQQIALLNFLEEQKTAVIHGLAGTGKTVLAVEKAKSLAEQRESVLFLCYNSFLKDVLRDCNSIPNVVFHNVHSLAYEILGNKGTSIEDLVNEFEDYLETVFEADDWIYSNVIVDEGQDLDDRLLNRLYELVKEKRGCFYVFYDRNQYIMKNQLPEWIENSECRLVLNKNCRNTAEIFKTSCSIIGVDEGSRINDIHGEIPYAKFYKSENELNVLVKGFIKKVIVEGNLKPDEIVILTATSLEKSWLNTDDLYEGYKITTIPKNNSILFTTIRKFKGLEAKAVLIIDVSIRGLVSPENKRLIYVGSSRAKYYLEIAFLEDLENNEIGDYLKRFDENRNVPKNKKGFAKLLNLKYKI
jgi:Cdc6-like AAA superfamily ATPase